MNKTEKGFNLYELSRARNWLYALAILMIVFFHSAINFESEILKTIKSNCCYAVETFFILSGISLYFSYSKEEDPVAFLKRRLKRLLPYYCVFYFVVFFINNVIVNFNLAQFLLNYTTLDFWFNGLGNAPWFLCAILAVYLTYPLLYNLFFKEYKGKEYFIAVAVVGILFFSYWGAKTLSHLGIFFTRIPAVLIGCALGKSVHDKKVIKWSAVVLLFLAFLISIYLRKTGQRLIFDIVYQNLLALCLIVLLTLIYKFNQKFIPFVNKIGFLGGFSFEIYMTHEKVQEMLYAFLNHLQLATFEYSAVWYQISAILIALAISISLGSLLNYLCKKKESTLKKE